MVSPVEGQENTETVYRPIVSIDEMNQSRGHFSRDLKVKRDFATRTFVGREWLLPRETVLVLRIIRLRSVLNAAARLIARRPHYSHISSYIKEHLHWLPVSTHTEYKVRLVVLKAQIGVASKYIRDAIRLPTAASSLRALSSLDRRELFVPRIRTTMAMSRSFSVVGPSIWNRHPPSARASFLSSNLSTSLSLLKTCLFSWS